jgi:hypothetical protein
MTTYYKDNRGQVLEFPVIPADSDMAHMAKNGWKKSTASAFKAQEKDRSLILSQFIPASADALGAPRVVGVAIGKDGRDMGVSNLFRGGALLGTSIG